MKLFKKVVILAFNPPWFPMILNGDKPFEFRDKIGNDWEEGTEVYLAMTKNMGGSGKVEGKFTIGKILEFDYGDIAFKVRGDKETLKKLKGLDLHSIGFDFQNYAIEIKDFQMLDEPIALEDIYAYNKVEEEMYYFSKEWVDRHYSRETQRQKKKRIEQAVQNVKINFFDNLEHYSACKIKRMPQSWCYGGVIEDVN